MFECYLLLFSGFSESAVKLGLRLAFIEQAGDSFYNQTKQSDYSTTKKLENPTHCFKQCFKKKIYDIHINNIMIDYISILYYFMTFQKLKFLFIYYIFTHGNDSECK